MIFFNANVTLSSPTLIAIKFIVGGEKKTQITAKAVFFIGKSSCIVLKKSI